MRPTRQNCIGRKIRVVAGSPHSTIGIVIAIHPAEHVPHVYWEAPGFSLAAAPLDRIEFVDDDTPLSDARPLSERKNQWTPVLYFPPSYMRGFM